MSSDREEEYYQRQQRQFVESDGMHTGSGHSFLNPTTNNLSEEEEGIKCDPYILTESGKILYFTIMSRAHTTILCIKLYHPLGIYIQPNLIISSYSLSIRAPSYKHRNATL